MLRFFSQKWDIYEKQVHSRGNVLDAERMDVRQGSDSGTGHCRP